MSDGRVDRKIRTAARDEGGTGAVKCEMIYSIYGMVPVTYRFDLVGKVKMGCLFPLRTSVAPCCSFTVQVLAREGTVGYTIHHTGK